MTNQCENLNWVVVVVEVALRNRSLVGGLRSCSSHLEDEEDDDEEDDDDVKSLLLFCLKIQLLNFVQGKGLLV